PARPGRRPRSACSRDGWRACRIGSWSRLSFLPSQQSPLDQAGGLVQENADQAEQEDAEKQQVHLEQLASLVEAPAQARPKIEEELGADRGEPGIDEAEMESGDDRREGGGQGDVAQELGAAEGENAGDLAVVRGNAVGAFGGVEDDRMEGGEGDEGDLRRLAGAEPHGYQRHPGEEGDLAVGGEGGAEHTLDEAREAQRQPDGTTDSRGDEESRDVAR